MAAPAQHIINELNEFMTAPALREIRSKYNSVRSQKLTSSILVATWQNENKFSSALAAPRIRLIRLIRGQKKDILGQKKLRKNLAVSGNFCTFVTYSRAQDNKR